MQYRISPIRFIAFFSLLLLAACQKKDTLSPSSAADITSFGIVGKHAAVQITSLTHNVDIRLDDTVYDATNLIATFNLSQGASAVVGSTTQVSGQSVNNFESGLPYTVTAANQTTQEIWTVSARNSDVVKDWGLGNFIKQRKSNEVSYEWYIDQSITDPYASVNCGPTSVTMAIKWADPSFTKTPQDARAKYPEGGDWWFTYDVDNYLTDNSIPHAIIPLAADAEKTEAQLAKQIDSGHIIILCIDMNYVSAGTNDAYHVDKFYSTTPNWGHFFVIKGYEQVDQHFYFQIYDPFSYAHTYTDGTLKGKNRFYRYNDVYNASSSWWNFAFVVGKKGETLDINTTRQAVDPRFITHRHGM